MAGERNYVRLPPDGVGKRVQSKYHLQIVYQGLSPTSYVWQIDQEYSLASGATFALNKEHSITSTTGILFATFSENDIQAGTVPVAGENIIDPDGLTVVAQVTSYVDQYTQAVNVVGANNPEYGLNVDQFGSAQIRFQDGPATTTPFGKLHATARNLLANYDFARSGLYDEFNTIEVFGGSSVWEKEYGHVKLAIAAQNDFTTHASQIWFPLEMGEGNEVIMATRLGDVGAPADGCARLWGAFGPSDGFFFQLVNDTFSVVHRRTFNGVKTEGVFNQADWNSDPLDGTGPSAYILDVTKNHAYFISWQWLGGGTISWGVINNGVRIVAHRMNMNAMTSNATLPSGLPICWAIRGVGSVVATHEIFAYGAGIYGGNEENIFEEAPPRNYFGNGYTIPSGSTSTQYQFTLSPEVYYRYATDVENHTLYRPVRLEVTAHDSVTGNPALAEVRLFSKCVVSDLQFENVRYSSVQVDNVGNHLAHKPEFTRFTVNGVGKFEFAGYIDGIQNGTVSNNNEQSIARRAQDLTLITGTFDKYGTGVDRVKVTVGYDPILGTDTSPIHFFDDKAQVVFRGDDGSTTLTGFAGATDLKTADGDWYYLALIDRDEAWLYPSASFIDDDRSVRLMTVNNTTNVTASQVITLGTGETAFVKDIVTVGSIISVEGRSSASFDAGYTGTWTTPTGGSGNVTAINGFDERVAADPTWTLVDERETYGADYKTSLQAIDSSGWANPSDSSTENELFGIPPVRAAWTFMVRSFYPPSNDIDLRWRMYWKEFKQ